MDEQTRKDALLAGKIAGKARDYGASLITEGASVKDILDKVEEFIRSNGAGIAFPAQISLNHIAAHACSDAQDETTIAASDVVKLDCGAHINGIVGDTAITVNLSGEHKELVEASKKALAAVMPLFTPGRSVGEIGGVIQETISDLGFAPVKNLSGHGLGRYDIHTFPSIPNIHIPNAPELKEGMLVACEPFATSGKGMITEGGEATVFTQVAEGRVRSPFARDALKLIHTYQGLPFATRWLQQKLGIGKTNLALNELRRAHIIQGHPPLKEVSNGLVSQREHTFLVGDTPIATTKKENE
jgi:methionyl aminopeptidase